MILKITKDTTQTHHKKYFICTSLMALTLLDLPMIQVNLSINLCPMTLLIFLAGATRARVIAANVPLR